MAESYLQPLCVVGRVALARRVVELTSPRDESGGFYHSSSGTDDFKRVGITQVSRCVNSGLPDPTEILRCGNVSIVMSAALATRPVSHVERFLAVGVPTLQASLAGREPFVRNDERSPVPRAFVSETADDLAPPSLSDVTGGAVAKVVDTERHLVGRKGVVRLLVEPRGIPKRKDVQRSRRGESESTTAAPDRQGSSRRCGRRRSPFRGERPFWDSARRRSDGAA